MSDDDHQGYIIEYVSVGNSVKVTAIDSATMTEVSMIGMPGMPKKDLATLAIRKLRYVLNKNQTES